MDRDVFRQYIHEVYAVSADQPFEGDFDTEVYRHAADRKWFALVMQITRDKLGFSEKDPIDVVNLKCDPLMIGSMRKEKGIYPAYHMNKTHWLTVVFSEAEDALIKMLLDQSYDLTAKKRSKKRKDEF